MFKNKYLYNIAMLCAFTPALFATPALGAAGDDYPSRPVRLLVPNPPGGGSDAVGAPQYWRLHGPGFAIEWCNIQNGANHVHTVWNDLSNGFGVDVLREHLSGERR